MSMQAIAVLDIGKTNKKVLIYDMDLNILDITIAGGNYLESSPVPWP